MEEIEEPEITSDLERETQKMYEEDQGDRVASGLFSTDPQLCFERDKVRYARAVEIVENKETAPLSPKSLFHLALLFQHGQKTKDYQLAQELAQESVDGGYEVARHFVCLAEDRYLLSINEKQKWGTQMGRDEEGNIILREILSDEESGVTDEARTANGIMTRTEMQKWIEDANKKPKDNKS